MAQLPPPPENPTHEVELAIKSALKPKLLRVDETKKGRRPICLSNYMIRASKRIEGIKAEME
eukprot:CAMPEP_0185582642 /NCGR_PEP_ID=MMETSP0434-20130131/21026_1 /TAXON_ID=626734 ORGANISM="Favella taraikaensis, Strain Fe Narragansett Bay" /NCGR_SAMPLE_ID=MMETSP0434 /ASSEMBLY_ACC=CAM_ASM_000379 /LENGTH=61 /DNA_ID=CAMNT_0028201513 /DNA_START=264 /DNA_END=449 /DNA_ORIENTATION=+